MKLEKLLPKLRKGYSITRKAWQPKDKVKYLKIDGSQLELFTGWRQKSNVAFVEISFMDSITNEDIIAEDWLLCAKT